MVGCSARVSAEILRRYRCRRHVGNGAQCSALGLERAALGPLFSAALFGMAIGAAGLAPLSDQLGRRLLLVAAMFLWVSACLPSVGLRYGFCHRFCDPSVHFGLGIGVYLVRLHLLPSSCRVAIELAVSLVVMGYPVGAVLAGPIANALIPDYGWTAVFTAGGITY